jgi:hypothetical protein
VRAGVGRAGVRLVRFSFSLKTRVTVWSRYDIIRRATVDVRVQPMRMQTRLFYIVDPARRLVEPAWARLLGSSRVPSLRSYCIFLPLFSYDLLCYSYSSPSHLLILICTPFTLHRQHRLCRPHPRERERSLRGTGGGGFGRGCWGVVGLNIKVLVVGLNTVNIPFSLVVNAARTFL